MFFIINIEERGGVKRKGIRNQIIFESISQYNIYSYFIYKYIITLYWLTELFGLILLAVVTGAGHRRLKRQSSYPINAQNLKN